MICICRICGKNYEGRAGGCICSDECRKEAARRHQKEYRMKNPDRAKQSARKWWNENRAKSNPDPNNMIINKSDCIAIVTKEPEPKKERPRPKHKKIATDSKWAKKYAEADRLTKIAMLSWALDKLEIAHLSYGQLSYIWLTSKYYKLLQQVLDRAKEEAI